MEKRLFLAVVLMTAAIMFTNWLFPPPPPPEGEASPDSVAVEGAAAEQAQSAVGQRAAAPLPTATSSVPGDSVVVQSDLYRFVISTAGAQVIRAEMLDYPSYVREGERVQLVPDDASEFLDYSLNIDGELVPLGNLNFETGARRIEVQGDTTVRFDFADPSGLGIAIEYHFTEDSYRIDARGLVSGLGERPASLQYDIGPRLEDHEAFDHHSEQEFAVVSRRPGDIDRTAFRSIDTPEGIAAGATWIGIKDKYFVAAVIGTEDEPLGAASIQPLESATKIYEDNEVALPQVVVTGDIPIDSSTGRFDFDLYLGPQEFNRLAQVGYDLEEVTPYGYRWIQPIIRPFAAAVLWVLTTLHESLGIAYGWVLVLFGVMMRIILWPINAKAMRAQMKNMAVQPLLQEIREKHKNDPQKQQEAMLTLYKEHGFNPLAGCLPMLIPFPVLITLFFVFRNTIAFRGAEFLWLPDLSLRDPFYILPVILVVSMFALQWISAHLSGMEQNPQMKMMMYFMPIMMGALFFMFPAGLNLYYATNQVASMPQQILIARERKRVSEELKASGGPKLGKPLKRTRKQKK